MRKVILILIIILSGCKFYSIERYERVVKRCEVDVMDMYHSYRGDLDLNRVEIYYIDGVDLEEINYVADIMGGLGFIDVRFFEICEIGMKLERDGIYHQYLTPFYFWREYGGDESVYKVFLLDGRLKHPVLGTTFNNVSVLSNGVIDRIIVHEYLHAIKFGHCSDERCVMYPAITDWNYDIGIFYCKKHKEKIKNLKNERKFDYFGK